MSKFVSLTPPRSLELELIKQARRKGNLYQYLDFGYDGQIIWQIKIAKGLTVVTAREAHINIIYRDESTEMSNKVFEEISRLMERDRSK